MSWRKFYVKLNRAKEHLKKGNLQAALMNLAEAIKIKLKGQHLKRELKFMGDDLYIFVQKLSQNELYVKTYGPVTFVEGCENDWLDFVQQLIALEEEGLLGRLNYAQEFLDKGQIDLARKAFEELLADYPDEAGLALDVGDRYMDFELYSDAEAAYRRAFEIDPNTLATINRLAISLRKEGKLDEALDLYKRALRLAPDDEGLYYNTARVVFDMGNPEVACKLLTIALEKNPEFEAGKKLYQHIKEKSGCKE